MAPCPKCNGERNCERFAFVNVPWNWEDQSGAYSISGGNEHSLLRCLGCETVFYLISSWHEDDIEQWYDAAGEVQSSPIYKKTTYPRPAGERPNWIEALEKKDKPLSRIMRQVYDAVDADSFILAAIGLRTAFDRASQILKIDPAVPFDSKLQEIKKGGWIGETEYQILKIIVDAGSAAAHRGWEPDAAELHTLISTMENFLQRTLVTGQSPLQIGKNIPPRPKRN